MFNNLLDSTKKKLQSIFGAGLSDLTGDIKGIGTDIQKSVQTRAESLGSVLGQKDRTTLEQGFRIPVEGVLLGSDIVGSAVKGGVKALLDPETEKKLSQAIGQGVKVISESPITQTLAKSGQEAYKSLPKELQGPVSTIGLLGLAVSDWASRGKTSEIAESVTKELAKETDERVIKSVLDTNTALDTSKLDIPAISKSKDAREITRLLESSVNKPLNTQILVPDQAQARVELESLRTQLGDQIVEDAYSAIRQAPAKTRNIVDELKTDYADILKAPELKRPEAVVKTDIPQDLLEEARKYKSAEEFVKAQGKPVYHGTNAQFDVFDQKKIGTQTDSGMFGRGFYFAVNEDMAKNAPAGLPAKNIMEVWLPTNRENFKLYSPRQNKTIQETANFLGVSEDILKNSPDGVVPKLDFAGVYSSAVADRGYQGVYIGRGRGGTEAVVFNPENIKTKPQLEEIWRQANELKKEAPVKAEAKVETPTPKLEEPLVPENFYDENRTTGKTTQLKEKVKETSEMIARASTKALTPISSVLEDIAPDLKTAIRQFEKDISKKTVTRTEEVLPLLKKSEKMNKNDRADFDLARKNGDDKKINELLTKYGMQKEYAQYRKTLDRIQEEANTLGIDIGYIQEYSPRLIKKPQEFLTYILERDADGVIMKAIQEKEDVLGRFLTVEEKANIANSLLRGYSTSNITLAKPSFAKARSIDIIDKNLDKFYESSDKALLTYIRSMTENIESRRFFGTNLKLATASNKKLQQVDNQIAKQETALKKLASQSETQKRTARKADLEFSLEALKKKKAELETKSGKLQSETNIEDNIGAYVLKGIAEGKIKPQDEKRISDILKARFNYRGTTGLASVYRDLEYASTMGNPLSTITQLGDFFMTMSQMGVGNTLKSLLGKKEITLKDLGIENVGKEFANDSFTSKAVQKIFQATGLTAIDKLSKETLLQGSLNRLRSQVKKSDKETLAEIDRIYGDKAGQFIDDVNAGKVTEDIEFWTWNDLADIQPISLSEMPQVYLEHPNGRLMYMLKTYTIKQLDLYKRKVYNEIQDGVKSKNPKKIASGLKNAFSLVALLAVGNATADELKEVVRSFFEGEDFKETTLKDRTIESLLKAIGLNRYMAKTFVSEGPSGVIGEQVLPPMSLLDAFGRDYYKAFVKEDKEPFVPKTVERIPLFGRELYWWLKDQIEPEQKQEESIRDKILSSVKPDISSSSVREKIMSNLR